MARRFNSDDYRTPLISRRVIPFSLSLSFSLFVHNCRSQASKRCTRSISVVLWHGLGTYYATLIQFITNISEMQMGDNSHPHPLSIVIDFYCTEQRKLHKRFMQKTSQISTAIQSFIGMVDAWGMERTKWKKKWGSIFAHMDIDEICAHSFKKSMRKEERYDTKKNINNATHFTKRYRQWCGDECFLEDYKNRCCSSLIFFWGREEGWGGNL